MPMKDLGLIRFWSVVTSGRSDSTSSSSKKQRSESIEIRTIDGREDAKAEGPGCSLPLLQVWPSQDSPPYSGERGEADGQSFVFPPESGASEQDLPSSGHHDSGIDSFHASPRDGLSPVPSALRRHLKSGQRPSWPNEQKLLAPPEHPGRVRSHSNSLHPDDARFIRLPASSSADTSASNSSLQLLPQSRPGKVGSEIRGHLNFQSFEDLTDDGSLSGPIMMKKIVASPSESLTSSQSSIDRRSMMETFRKMVHTEEDMDKLPSSPVEEARARSPQGSIVSSNGLQFLQCRRDRNCRSLEEKRNSLDPRHLFFNWSRRSSAEDRSESVDSCSGVSDRMSCLSLGDDRMRRFSSNNSLRSEMWTDERRASRQLSVISTSPNRYSLLDSVDLEYMLRNARGSIGPYSISESFHKLTFTQSLAFPELARGEREKQRRAYPHNETEMNLNAFAKVITVLVLVLVSMLVCGVIYKFLKI